MNTINEKQALEVLNANSFREISKEKILNFMSMLPNMEPEVAKKALDQFPQFGTCASKVLGDYKELTEKAIESSDANLADTLRGRLITIDGLNKMLESDNLTFEQKMDVAKEMAELSNQNSEDVRRDNAFKLEVLGIAASLFFAALGAAASILGGRGSYRS